MALQETIEERLAFLQEQIRPNNKPTINQTFQIQIDAIQRADIEKLGILIIERRTKLQNSTSIQDTERLFTELEALEWLKRQVDRYSY